MAPKLRLPPCRASPCQQIRKISYCIRGWMDDVRLQAAASPPPSPQSLLPSMGKDYQKRKLARDFKTPAPDVWKKPRGGGAGNEGGEEEPKQGNGFNKFDLSSDAFTTYYQVLENLIIIVRATPQCRPAPVSDDRLKAYARRAGMRSCPACGRRFRQLSASTAGTLSRAQC